MPATELARDVIARKACVDSPLARCFRVFFSAGVVVAVAVAGAVRVCVPARSPATSF